MSGNQLLRAAERVEIAVGITQHGRCDARSHLHSNFMGGPVQCSRWMGHEGPHETNLGGQWSDASVASTRTEAPAATIKLCPSCGVGVMPGDGGIRAHGQTFCSEECANEADA